MVRLEEIVAVSRLKGVTRDEFIEVVAARSYGPDAVEITYKAKSNVTYRSPHPADRTGGAAGRAL